MNRWVIYAASSAMLMAVTALFISISVESESRLGILAGLATAWLVQAAAFAILVAATRRKAEFVFAGWTIGSLLRLAALALLGWLTLSGTWPLPAQPTLIALVIALFVLLLLEPVFLRCQAGAR